MPTLPTSLVIAVVPALNERDSVAAVVERVANYVDEVIVIDDGSSDDTGAVAAGAGAIVIRHPDRRGVGAAVASGLVRAKDVGATAVVQVDGDGQHDADGIRDLLAALDSGADLVIGTRFERGFDMVWVRRLALAIFARLISYRLGMRITDPTSGFRAFSPRAVDVLMPIFPVKYLSDTVEVLYLAAGHGLRVVTVPVSMYPRTGGKPSVGTVQSIGYAARMMGIVAKHAILHRHRQRESVRRDVSGGAASALPTLGANGRD
jgi:glycosyltransferase involved in cell wall biosynthesis